MKKLLTISAVLFSALVFGQQEFQTTQYQQNMYLLNPAAAGIKDYVDVNLGFRQQWTGISGAPKTYFISANSLLGKKSIGGNELFSLRISDPSVTLKEGNTTVKEVDRKLRHALGGYFMADEAGAFKNHIGAISYAIHLPISDQTTLSFGLQAKIRNMVFDASSVNFSGKDQNQTFQDFQSNSNNNTFLDAGTGLFLYHNNFFAGYSIQNLFNNELAFGDATTQARLKGHHYLTGGYRFNLSDKVGFTPSALLRMTSGAPMSLDLTGRVDINNKFWGALTVRPQDAVAIMAGFGIAKNLNIGYSYDITTSTLNNGSNGSHEFVLNIMLDKN
ncbi:PorP/SprF family type IX secretion system membrane protein [Luteibaculum oceani]|uniref:Type IX secretion system membrane protein PorP/SprF n=1 Tax=Luteibaculum oceani TaxID=1294296 RepID=A0A5C6UUD8_9FLAO|nr:type IX secretion system membrane protein PorP/SprF [Luteibaculum oceani]TXC76993.1 type IX secretion system membrane protein PorP/SprF [Luteibaculum oceani]